MWKGEEQVEDETPVKKYQRINCEVVEFPFLLQMQNGRTILLGSRGDEKRLHTVQVTFWPFPLIVSETHNPFKKLSGEKLDNI